MGRQASLFWVRIQSISFLTIHDNIIWSAGEILAQSLPQIERNIHPVVIISAFNKALKALDWRRLESVLSKRFTQLGRLCIQMGSHTGDWNGPALALCRKILEKMARERLSAQYMRLLEIEDSSQMFVSVHYSAW